MTKHHTVTKRSAGAVRIVAVCTLAALAGACKHGDDPTRVAGWSLVDASQRHPILVSQKPTTLALAVHRGSNGLTPRQRADLLDFASSYRGGDAGNSRLVISAPSGGANEVAGVTLMSGDLGRLPDALALAKAALRLVRVNVAFSIIVKLMVFGLVLVGYGTMWLAVLADVGTTLIITVNEIRILGWKRNK